MAETNTAQLEWSPTLGKKARMSYAKAERAVKALGPGWRMPTIQELLSLVDYGAWKPAIDIELYLDTVPGAYWTATPCAAYPFANWAVDFYFGNAVYMAHDGHGSYLRACRELPAGAD